MGTMAYWLSGQERVEVEAIVETNSYGKCWSPRFQAKRQDGSITTIDRSDIILEDEQALIDELAHILYSSKYPVQHERYAVIMRQFLVRGVPYVAKLRNRKPHQEALDLFSVG